MRWPSKKLRMLVGGAVAGVALLLSSASACQSGSSNGNAITNAQQGVQDTQYAYVQPLPYFPFSRIRQNLIEIEAINALGIASTTFMFIPGVPNPVLVCPSVGVPVPSTDQLSNPYVPAWNGSGGTNNQQNSDAGVAIGQQEPMGVFTGDSSGTNSLCVNSTGGQYEGYNEAYDVSVTTSAYWDPNKWGPGKGYIMVTGAPVMPVCTVHKYQGTDSSGNATTNYEEVCTDPTKPAPKTVPTPPAPSASPSSS
jgi:hypothetical protein